MVSFNVYGIGINLAVIKHGFGCVVKFRNSYNACCTAADACCANTCAKAGYALRGIGINFKALCFNITAINFCRYFAADGIGIAGKACTCTNADNAYASYKAGHITVIACINDYVCIITGYYCRIAVVYLSIGNASVGTAVNLVYINRTCHTGTHTSYTGSNKEGFHIARGRSIDN